MTNLKSQHLWDAIENAKRDHSPDDLGVPYFVVWAMLDDIAALRRQVDSAPMVEMTSERIEALRFALNSINLVHGDGVKSGYWRHIDELRAMLGEATKEKYNEQ